MGARYGLGRGFEVYDDDVRKGAKRREAEGLGNAYQRRADETTERALAWLAEQDGDEPVALLVHFFDAHDATLVPPRAFLESRVTFPLPADLDEQGHLVHVQSPERKIELYDAEIAYMDAELARLLAAFEARGWLESTLVAVLADHGEGLGAHDFWTHGLLWDEQLRVPLVLAGPGVPVALSVSARARLVDLTPTLAELLGLAPVSGLDGASLVPLFAAQPERVSREVYAEVHHAPADRLGRPSSTPSCSTRGSTSTARPTARTRSSTSTRIPASSRTSTRPTTRWRARSPHAWRRSPPAPRVLRPRA
jgi:arylsulfatase A-like enzyme